MSDARAVTGNDPIDASCICTLCQIMTQKAAAEILKMPASTLSDLLHRIITRVRYGHNIRGLVTLGVDEISFCKGRKHQT